MAVNIMQDTLHTTFTTRTVSIQSDAAVVGKLLLQNVFNPLRTMPEQNQIAGLTVSTQVRLRRLRIAMVTIQAGACCMIGQIGITARTASNPAAVVTKQSGCVTPPVKEQNYLLVLC